MTVISERQPPYGLVRGSRRCRTSEGFKRRLQNREGLQTGTACGIGDWVLQGAAGSDDVDALRTERARRSQEVHTERLGPSALHGSITCGSRCRLEVWNILSDSNTCQVS